MFKINGNDIYISRGEGATLTVTPLGEDGGAYTFQTGDKQVLEVRDRRTGETMFTIDSGGTDFSIGGEHTSNMSGKYDYRVTLKYGQGGESVVIGQTPNYTPHFVVMEG